MRPAPPRLLRQPTAATRCCCAAPPSPHAVLEGLATWPAGQAWHTAAFALPPGLMLSPAQGVQFLPTRLVPAGHALGCAATPGLVAATASRVSSSPCLIVRALVRSCAGRHVLAGTARPCGSSLLPLLAGAPLKVASIEPTMRPAPDQVAKMVVFQQVSAFLRAG